MLKLIMVQYYKNRHIYLFYFNSSPFIKLYVFKLGAEKIFGNVGHLLSKREISNKVQTRMKI